MGSPEKEKRTRRASISYMLMPIIRMQVGMYSSSPEPPVFVNPLGSFGQMPAEIRVFPIHVEGVVRPLTLDLQAAGRVGYLHRQDNHNPKMDLEVSQSQGP